MNPLLASRIPPGFHFARCPILGSHYKDLAQLSREKYEPSLASSILTRAYQFFDEEDFKYALIEGVTALELPCFGL
jgi:hypothetical protein